MKIKEKIIYLFVNKHGCLEAHAKFEEEWIAKTIGENRGPMVGNLIRCMTNSLNFIEKLGWSKFEKRNELSPKEYPLNPSPSKYPITFVDRSELKNFYNEKTYCHIK